MLITFNLHNAKWPAWEAIKTISEGDITHVSIWLVDENYSSVWEARFWEKIRPIPWREYKHKDSIVRSIIFEVYEKNRISEMMKWLRKQEGKWYDWLGVLSFIWFFIPVKNGKWFCSEFATVFLMKFIAQVERYDQKQTPYWFENLALLVKLLERVYS
jgi:hypothetical protein